MVGNFMIFELSSRSMLTIIKTEIFREKKHAMAKFIIGDKELF